MFYSFAALLPVSGAAADMALFPLLVLGVLAPLWHRRGYRSPGRYGLAVALFIGVVLLSCCWSLDACASLGKLHRLAFLLLIFQTPAFLGGDGDLPGWRRAGWCLIGGAAVRALYDAAVILLAAARGASIYDAGSMINPQFFMVALCLLAAGWWPRRRGGRDIPRVAAWVATGAGLVLHFKRGVWLATAAALGGLLVWRRRWKWIVAVALGAAALVAVPQVRARLAQLPEEFSRAQGGRWVLWTEVAPALIRQYPLGIGWQATEHEHLAAHAAYVQPGLDHLHNNVLQTTLELGFHGLAVWLLWMGWTLVLLYRTARRLRLRGHPAAQAAAGLLAAFGGLLINGVVESNFNTGSVMRLYCLLIGLMLCLVRLEAATRADPAQP